MPLLTVEHIEKSYELPAVRDVSVTLEKGEIVCLLGPSGCGKTTLLRLIAGLEQPDAGRVYFDGRDVTDLPPHRRNFGLMFQEFALFPHKSVYENVAFGVQMQQAPAPLIRARTREMLDLVGLARLSRRNVADLSGGERQRVALARSLAPRPRLLMLDEPLGALDRALRERLLPEMRAILKRLEISAIFVTHDQSEALAVGDRVAVMHAGRLEQVDPPETLYRYPQRGFVARFLGFENLIEGSVSADGGIDSPLGRLFPVNLTEAMIPNTAVTVVLRPEGARMATDSNAEQHLPRIAGRVASRIFNGQSYRIGVSVPPDVTLVFDLPNETIPPDVGKPIALNLRPSAMVVIPTARFNENPLDTRETH
jgi:ABC-type Fe3+/spermidine/putrescine transport system ATPase subunit